MFLWAMDYFSRKDENSAFTTAKQKKNVNFWFFKLDYLWGEYFSVLKIQDLF